MKDKKFIYGILIAVVFLLTVGITYAYFSLIISGNDVAETINVDTTKLELKYTDGKEVRATNIEPGWTMTKTITVVNAGNEEAYYTLGWQKLFNEIQKNELVIRSECTSSGVTGGTCDNTDNVVVPQTAEVTAETNKVLYPYKEAALILPGETHTYTVTIEFINYTNKPQNYNQSKKFHGVLGIVEAYNTYNLTLNISNADGTPVANSEVTLHSNPMTGTTDENGTVIFNDVELGDHSLDINKNNNIINTSIKLMGGANDIVQADNKYNVKIKKENITLNVKLSDNDINNLYVKGKRKCYGEVTNNKFVDGQYTYTYNSYNDAWGIILTDATSTDPVITEMCKTVNDKPIVGMGATFRDSKASSIDVSSFDTSNVTYMNELFKDSAATEIIGLENFNTSKVTTMWRMFSGSKAVELGLSNYNTSNVTNMSEMFQSSAAESLDLSSFDTGKTNNMYGMFMNSSAISLDLSNFDTSNVANMHAMFYDSAAVEIKGLEKFNTSKVEDMAAMFQSSKATSLDLSSFNTSNVTNMGTMFSSTAATEIKGLKNFNTSSVTSMEGMFQDCAAESLDLSSFDTSKVIQMRSMFSGSKATSLDLSNFDTSNVTNMRYMFYSSKATSLNLSNFDTSNVTNMDSMFHRSSAEVLDLSSFDTSKVTNMFRMFYMCDATVIDLSSFDTTNVTNISNMFYNCSVSKGYARNQTEADKFNGLIGSNVFSVK